ncbi:MAG: MFS transporter, partial [Lentisphaeria bacterium]|nr:MFS transporter [Lentisphaeria bacterium]
MQQLNVGNNCKSQQKWNWWLLATAVVIYFFVNFQRSSIPGTIFNQLQSAFNASAAEVTSISAVFMYVYAATQLVAGLAADKFGGTRTILWGALMLVIGSLIFPVCGNLGLLLLGRVLVGFGCGAIYLAIVKEIDRIYPEKFTSVLGTVILLGYA